MVCTTSVMIATVRLVLATVQLVLGLLLPSLDPAIMFCPKAPGSNYDDYPRGRLKKTRVVSAQSAAVLVHIYIHTYRYIHTYLYILVRCKEY